MEIESR
jgi:hypothetical protein